MQNKLKDSLFKRGGLDEFLYIFFIKVHANSFINRQIKQVCEKKNISKFVKQIKIMLSNSIQ